jgi:hypothetical protein
MKSPIILAALLAATPAFAQEPTAGRTTLYFGAGTNTGSSDFADSKTPFSLGLMHQVEGKRLVLGFDIGSEGMMHDSTWGADREQSAMSINLLVGANLYSTPKTKIDAALLVGMREEYSDCPDSYLGYQCYADTDPSTDYTANVGVVTTVSYGNFLTGLRVTGESAQALFGFRF